MVAFAPAQPTKITVDEARLVATITRDSFFEFVKEFWGTIIAEKPEWNWHIRYLCATMQAMAERVFRGERRLHDYVINVPPGTTKTTIVSIMFPAWVWTRMPSARFITASYTQDLAWDNARKSREVIKSEKYRACFPEIEMKRDQDTKSYFANTRHGFRKSIGANTAIIGFHSHFHLIDDPIDPNGVISDDILNSVNNWLVETLFQRKIDKKITVAVLIMQRLAQNDPSGYLLENQPKRWRHICLPADINNPGNKNRVEPPHLKRYYMDGLLDPMRLDYEVLEEKRSELREYGYACQFDQYPIPRGGATFVVDKMLIMPHAPVKRDIVRMVRYWDKAATPGAGMFTVGCKGCIDRDGVIWVMDVVRGQWDTATRERIIRQTAEADGYECEVGVEQEPGSGGKDSAEDTLKRLRGFRVRIERPHGDKVMRADAFSVYVNEGLVRLVAGPWVADFLNEYRFFPHSTYKDQVDGGSGMFRLLANAPIVVGAL